MFLSRFISLVIGPKRRWWAYKARLRQLPANYRSVLEAVERYLHYAGGLDNSSAVVEDLLELFEQAAARGTPVREVVGDDPVEFVEAFVRNYEEGSWRVRERERLISAVARAAGEDTPKGGAPH
jgi:DNA-binding ferritin-like protein (Dps family)